MQAKNSNNLSNFNKAFYALPSELKKEIREIIKKECFLETDFQFYNRKTGKVKIREYEAARIIEAFAKYGVDAKTGQVLQIANHTS